MTSVTLTTRFDSPVQWKERMGKLKRWTVKVYHRHSDLVSQLGLFSLNTAILASKIFKQIPAAVPRVSLVLLNYTGMLYLNIAVRDITKCCRDVKHAAQAGDRTGMLWTAAKVAMKGTNTLLTCGLFAASLIALGGGPAVALAMYQVMRPFGMVSWFTGIGLEIGDYIRNHRLLKDLDRLSVKRRRAVEQHFVSLVSKKKIHCQTPEQKLAMRALRQMELHTVETYRRGLQKQHKVVLFDQMRKSIQMKQRFTQANLGLIGLGYACLGVSRAYPDTLLQASTTWMISLLYTGKLVIQKIIQARLSRLLKGQNKGPALPLLRLLKLRAITVKKPQRTHRGFTE